MTHKLFKKIFSIKSLKTNNKWHRVITILGIKLSFRNKEREIFEKQKLYNDKLKKINDSLKKTKESIEIIKELKSNNKILMRTNQELYKQLQKVQKEVNYVKEWQQNFYKNIPQKYPISLSLREKEAIKNNIKNAKMYLEFGSGGSTFIAIETECPKIHSVESDRAWIDYLNSYLAIDKAIKSGKLVMHHIDIGQTKEWGYPVNDDFKERYPHYSNEIFKDFEKDKIDLVLIDGRFRVACALNVILNCPKTTKIMIHDYTVREYYHVVEDFLEPVEIIDSLAIFKIKENIDLEKARNLYQKYKYIKE